MKGRGKARLGWSFVGLAVTVVAAIALTPAVRVAIHRSDLAETLCRVKQVKFALDGFAADFNGQYPNRATGAALGLRDFDSSNDYFRQLFLAEETTSEMIFWAKRSLVAGSKPPDDVIRTRGVLDPAVILPPGDVHWAYLPAQHNTADVAHPLLCDPFPPGTTAWDAECWENKIIVARVDGSVRAFRLAMDGEIDLGDPLRKSTELFNDLVQPEPTTP